MNVLVIAAHPDDEILGVGATIHKLSSQGNHIEVLILSDGVGLRNSHLNFSLEDVRNNVIKANLRCGVSKVHFGGFNTFGKLLDEYPNRDVVNEIKNYLSITSPEIVFTHFPNDIHIDHRIISESTFYALKVQALTSVKKLFCYQVLSSTEQYPSFCSPTFIPNVYWELDSFNVSAKLDSLKIYSHELYPFPHPRSLESIEILARFRGTEVGLRYAEAFSLVKEIYTDYP